MSFRRKLLGAFVIVFLLLVFQRWLFALLNMLLNGNSDLVFAQMVDYFGLPPTLYTGNISCPGCNQFNVPYVIQPHQTAYCTHDKPVFLLILVASHPENYYRRIAIRRSWGSLSAHNRKSIRTYFVVGRSANRTTQDSLEDEAAQWHDVLQVDIVDHYQTATNKSIASMMWAIGYCGRHFRFLLKTDDDVFIVPERFVDYLKSLTGTDRKDGFAFVGGVCTSGDLSHSDHGHVMFRAGKSHSQSVLPQHCKGSAYLLSNSAALQILAKSTDVLFDANEDVFVTGICRSVARISCKTVPGFGITEGETIDDCDVVSGRVISIHNVTSAQRVTKLWSFLYDDSASKLRCGSTMSTPPVVVACVATVALLAVLCLLLVYRRKPLSAVLRKR